MDKQKILSAVAEIRAELRVQCLPIHFIAFLDRRLSIIEREAKKKNE